MILYYFPIAQNTVNKTVSDFFQRCKCLYMMCTYFTIFLFTGLIPFYLWIRYRQTAQFLHFDPYLGHSVLVGPIKMITELANLSSERIWGLACRKIGSFSHTHGLKQRLTAQLHKSAFTQLV